MKKKTKKKIQLIEIARSFSLKVNLGNYEMADFFASQKAECPARDAEKISEALHQFCRAEVIKSVNLFKGKIPEMTVKPKEFTPRKLDKSFVAEMEEAKKHPPEEKEKQEFLDILQGKSPAERRDKFREVREGVMMDESK